MEEKKIVHIKVWTEGSFEDRWAKAFEVLHFLEGRGIEVLTGPHNVYEGQGWSYAYFEAYEEEAQRAISIPQDERPKGLEDHEETWSDGTVHTHMGMKLGEVGGGIPFGSPAYCLKY